MFHYNIGLCSQGKDDQDHIPTRGRHYTRTQVNWGGRVGGWVDIVNRVHIFREID